MKFYPHGIGRERQTVTYETVKDHITQYVQKMYKEGQDIAKSLRELVKVDLTNEKPVRQMWQETGDKKQAEQDGLDINYQEKLKMYLE